MWNISSAAPILNNYTNTPSLSLTTTQCSWGQTAVLLSRIKSNGLPSWQKESRQGTELWCADKICSNEQAEKINSWTQLGVYVCVCVSIDILLRFVHP